MPPHGTPPDVSVVTAAVVGGTIGVRHALEADHLAAVATLVEVDADRSPARIGASWGIGHSLPIAALGLSFLALGVRLPGWVTLGVEGVVGLVLVALGVRMCLAAIGRVHLGFHSHGTGASDGPDTGASHRHLRLGRLSVGPHLHLHGESTTVGVLHGFAGSGALVVAMVAATPTATGALGFLAGFSLLSISTMAVVSFVWGRTLDTGFRAPLQVVAGLIGVAVGLALLVSVLGLTV